MVKYCRDCVHSSIGKYCYRDANIISKTNIVTGENDYEIKGDIYECYKERDTIYNQEHEECGPEGKFFVKKSLWFLFKQFFWK